ncbi:unnamed protein product [Allacma fusca]|uniref:Sodium/potassium-transporting ATPase subunit beta-1-interacting protein n=1 Tax=Allacma fusca TaxID=39272 RepID=A0A8J2PIM3_9HEXA|nr:unnamed protein product [Allacma fusca]
MGFCTRRRVYVLFLTVATIQIITTGARQIFDFLGPLWSLIFTNFLNIVFTIFGFFGGYTKRKHYLISYIVWTIAWMGWNLLILCLYIPVPTIEPFKSAILSLGTGGFSWWETRAPGCTPDWASETQLLVTNCSLDPRVVECLQAGLQVYLAIVGVTAALCIILFPHSREDDKDSVSKNGDTTGRGSFYSISRNGTAGRSARHRAALNLPGTSAEMGGTSGSNGVLGTVDDRLRPMTPRRVKRRSARSIQSQKFGPQGHPSDSGRGSAGPSGSGNSARNSIRSNTSSRRNNARNSKRKMNHFVSPINRLMQQVDSETSHDDHPHTSRYPISKYPMRDQGHVNPVYLGPQSPRNPPPPPRPPSARSSYSNYHPARLPPMTAAMSPSINPNVLNLNQNIFTNHAFDTSTEYNNSQLSNNTNNTFYEEEIQFNPGPNHMPPPPTNPMTVRQSLQYKHHSFVKGEVNIHPEPSSNALAYPLAHSPVSQESFPMWGVAQAQVPTGSTAHQHNHKPYHPINSIHPHGGHYSRQPINSETVI